MAQLMQTCTQAFALVNLVVLLLVPIRQSAVPSIMDAIKAFRRWHAQNYRKPQELAVADLAAEAPGTCNICLNELWDDESAEGLLRLACSHTYHAACIEGWLYSHETCPMCRRPVPDMRRCTKIVQKPIKEMSHANTFGTQQATVVTILGGTSRSRSRDDLETRTPVLSILLPPPALSRESASTQQTSGSSSASSSRSQSAETVSPASHLSRGLSGPRGALSSAPRPTAPVHAWSAT